MRITLPWPPKVLSPNSRAHWRRKYAASLKCRRLAYYTATMASADQREHVRDSLTLKMTLTFLPPDKRRRDLDNIEAAMKAYLDGIFQACKADDSAIRMTVKTWGDVVQSGAVIVEII